MLAKDVADLDQQGRGGGAVVGSVELDVAQRIVRLVVGGEDDDAVFLAGIFDDVVVHRLETGRRAGGKGVGFEISLGGFDGEVLLDELFSLQVAGRAVEALGCNLQELRGEIVGGLAVEVGRSCCCMLGLWRSGGQHKNSNGRSKRRPFDREVRGVRELLRSE